MKELRLQDKVVLSARHYGGHARKWSSAFQVGMPDLIIALPLYGTFLAEVKIINAGKKSNHPVTPKQIHEINKWVMGGGRAILLCGIVIGRDVHLVGASHLQNVSISNWEDFPKVQWGPKVRFDLPDLIEQMKEKKTWPN